MSLQVHFESDRLYSRREIAAQVGCCARTVVRAEKRGELMPLRLSSRLIRYRASDVARWIASSLPQNCPAFVPGTQSRPVLESES